MTEVWPGRAEEMCMQCGGFCCVDAHPPVLRSCSERPAAAVVSEDLSEYAGYKRLKVQEDGACILSCAIHTTKPETCQAGLFTSDVKGDIIEIFPKFSRICPLVTLREKTPQAYPPPHDPGAKSITRLVRNLTQDEIGAVCRVDEPETGKVSEIPRRSQENS